MKLLAPRRFWANEPHRITKRLCQATWHLYDSTRKNKKHVPIGCEVEHFVEARFLLAACVIVRLRVQKSGLKISERNTKVRIQNCRCPCVTVYRCNSSSTISELRKSGWVNNAVFLVIYHMRHTISIFKTYRCVPLVPSVPSGLAKWACVTALLFLHNQQVPRCFPSWFVKLSSITAIPSGSLTWTCVTAFLSVLCTRNHVSQGSCSLIMCVSNPLCETRAGWRYSCCRTLFSCSKTLGKTHATL